MTPRWNRECTVSSGDVSGRQAPAARTYPQIAAILSERSGRPVSPASVRCICRSAETKLVRGCLADPVLRGWLRSGAPCVC